MKWIEINIWRLIAAFLMLFWGTVFMVASSDATVNITTSRIQYSCNGSTTVFAYPFKVYEDDDLEVITANSSYVEATLALNTDYTVSGAGDDSGGDVTLTAGSNCPNGNTLTILRNVDITQDTDYSDGQTLTADGLESPPDKSRIIDQQFKEDSDRSIKIIKSSTLSDLTIRPGADKAIFFNSSGTGLVTRAFGSSTLAIPADESIVADMINAIGIPAIVAKLSVLDLAGGTMTGDIVLAGDPDAALKAATKQYVDMVPRIRDVSRNLIIENNSSNPAYQMDIDADETILQNDSGSSFMASSVNETVDITVSGVNGLDTGSEAGSTWYFIWSIAKVDGTVDSLLSLSSTAPTLPSGYTFKSLVGAVRNDSSSNFIPITQNGNKVEYDAVQGIKDGGFTASVWTAQSLAAFFPTTAKRIICAFGSVATEMGLSPRSDGHSGAYSKAAVAIAGTFGGVLSSSKPIWDTLNIRYETSIYYWVTDANSTLDATGWEY